MWGMVAGFLPFIPAPRYKGAAKLLLPWVDPP